MVVLDDNAYPEIDSIKMFVGKQYKSETMLPFLTLITI